MSWSKVVVIALGAALAAGPAWAQDDDDLLSPLAPKKKGEKPKAKPKAKPKPAPAASKPAPASDDELAPLTPQKGELVLKIATPNKRAKVMVDDKELGGFPVPTQSLSPGEHTVIVRALGHTTFTKKVTIVANKPTEVMVALEGNAAIVSVSTDAVGATVLINGKSVGTAPIEELEVPPGATTIAVRKEGYKDASQTVKLVAGNNYPFTVKLGAPIPSTAIVATPVSDRPVATNLTPSDTGEPAVSTTVDNSPPIYQRWYFWAGAAAVVAAVAVGTAVGVSSNQPKPLGEKAICGDSGCDSCIGFTCTIMPATGIRPFKPGVQF